MICLAYCRKSCRVNTRRFWTIIREPNLFSKTLRFLSSRKVCVLVGVNDLLLSVCRCAFPRLTSEIVKRVECLLHKLWLYVDGFNFLLQINVSLGRKFHIIHFCYWNANCFEIHKAVPSFSVKFAPLFAFIYSLLQLITSYYSMDRSLRQIFLV